MNKVKLKKRRGHPSAPAVKRKFLYGSDVRYNLLKDGTKKFLLKLK